MNQLCKPWPTGFQRQSSNVRWPETSLAICNSVADTSNSKMVRATLYRTRPCTIAMNSFICPPCEDTIVADSYRIKNVTSIYRHANAVFVHIITLHWRRGLHGIDRRRRDVGIIHDCCFQTASYNLSGDEETQILLTPISRMRIQGSDIFVG